MTSPEMFRCIGPDHKEIERVARRLRRELEERHHPGAMDPIPLHGPGRQPRPIPNPREGARSWWLALHSGGEPCQIRVGRGVTVIGRDLTCDIRVSCPTVSRFHCRVELQGDCLHVEDLRSRNGTYHNERRILETELVSGDELSLGSVVFRAIAVGATPKPAYPQEPMRGDETLFAYPAAS